MTHFGFDILNYWGVTILLNSHYQYQKLHPVLSQLRTGMINLEVTAFDKNEEDTD